jgi:hypothetical protein
VTPDELAARLAPWRAQLERWLPLVGAVVLALVVVRQCNGRRAAEAALEAERRRASEARALADAGVEVVDQEGEADVDRRVAELEAANADLRAANERLRSAAPGARPVSAARASTGRVAAGGAPRGATVAASPSPGYDAAPTPAQVVAAPPASAQAGGACLLAPGDVAEARVDAVAWRTDKGNHLVTLALGAYRLSPGPEAKLFGGPASLELTHAVELETPPLANGNGAGWGAGPVGGVNTAGWVAGLVVATPSARVPLIGWRAEWWVATAGGPGGFVALTGPLLRP